MMSTSTPYFSVIIIGAGPTGLAIGNLLGLYGIDALILERNPALSDSPKAISLDDEGLRVCQAMGLKDAVIEHLLFDLDARYLSGKHVLATVAPTSMRNGFPFISTFHQPAFEAILLVGLKRFPSITLQFQHTLEAFEQIGESVRVSVRAPDGTLRPLECAYLLACDGAKSFVRRALNIPLRGSTFAQKWLVIDTIHDSDPSMVATFFCNPARPAVSVPAPDHGRRWEFMLLPGEKEEDVLDHEKMRALIRQSGGPPLPHIVRAAIYTFHAALAATFSAGRVFLLGDAAHLMPPFGGQGMNSGLRDTHNLAWKLALVLQGLASPSLLDTYTLECRAHARQMIRLSAFLGSVVMPTSRPGALLRDAIFLTLNVIPPIREYLTEARLKPQPRYKRGFLYTDHSKACRLLSGRMLPQPTITTPDGESCLLDDILGPNFALLCLTPHSDQPFSSLSHPIWQKLDVRFITIPGPTSDLLINGHFSADDGLFLLVRPDRYIFGVAKTGGGYSLAEALQRKLADRL